MIPFSIRSAVSGDEQTVRALRLEALSDAPEAFGSTYDRELARSDADWRGWFSPGVTFILERSGVARGMACGVRDSDDLTMGHVTGHEKPGDRAGRREIEMHRSP